MANEISIRIYVLDEQGRAHDTNETFGIESFAGQIPAIGDTILDPGVLSHLDRSDPTNRRVWTVRNRVFNPRDLQDYVTLIVEEREGSRADPWAY
jgi:hypothetical protein